MGVSVGKAVKYVVLPGIWPRFVALFSTGFVHISLCIAYAYSAARLLPPNHPYLNPQNIGRFGIRHVIAEAHRNLRYQWRHADQIIIYYTSILGLLLLLAQFMILIFSFVARSAQASIGDYYARFFVTPDPINDITFRFLDRVFGLQGIFGSCLNFGSCPTRSAEAAVEIWPTQMHYAFHGFLNFYNTGIMAVAIIVILYMIMVLVVETAESGTPFGKRFNHAWVPVRMILAFAMLIPLGSGLNVAQITTLYIVKWSSSLATNGWIIFNQTLAQQGSTPGGMPRDLVVMPVSPEFNTFLEYMMVAHTCAWAEKWSYGYDIKLYQVLDNNTHTSAPASFMQAFNNAKGKDILLSFGIPEEGAGAGGVGKVRPVCGEVNVSVKGIDSEGIKTLQSGYYDILYNMYHDSVFKQDGLHMAQLMMPNGAEKDPNAPMPDANYLTRNYVERYNEELKDVVLAAHAAQADDVTSWENNVLNLGWGGAGIWYNKIAQINGGLVAAANNLPTPQSYPEVMEHVAKQKRATNMTFDSRERFNPYVGEARAIEFFQPADEYIAITLYKTQNLWRDQFAKPTGNSVGDIVVAIFGLEGLISMKDNVNTHPLAQLTGVGRSIIESSVRNLGFSFGAGIMGGLANFMEFKQVGAAGQAASSMMKQVGTLALGIGFILAYLVPLLPFVYFFFSVASWVKVLFEAVIAMPLWAIGHMRIDGEGIMGRAAKEGYIMLLEIFLRPILVIVGLVASVILFAAQVQVLHEIWDLVTQNIYTGHGPDASTGTAALDDTVDALRNSIDMFFYMIMYAIIVYMIGLASFKMIDLVPNNILRWMNASSSVFQEYEEDVGGSLLRNTYQKTQNMMGNLSSSANLLLMRNS